MAWDEPEDYDYLDDLDRDGWAFEFLRRNPEYRADFLEQQQRLKDSNLAKQSASESAESAFIAPDSGPSPHCIYEPDWPVGMTFSEWSKTALESGAEPRSFPITEWFLTKWGIESESMPNPAAPLSEPFKLRPSGAYPRTPTLEEIASYFHGDWDPEDPHEPFGQLPNFGVVVFDLELPLTVQLAKAKELLLAKQEAGKADKTLHFKSFHKSGNAKYMLTRYLRLLDALETDASADAIAKTLLGHSDIQPSPNYGYSKLYDTKRIALQYRDEKFRAIPTWPPFSD